MKRKLYEKVKLLEATLDFAFDATCADERSWAKTLINLANATLAVDCPSGAYISYMLEKMDESYEVLINAVLTTKVPTA